MRNVLPFLLPIALVPSTPNEGFPSSISYSPVPLFIAAAAYLVTTIALFCWTVWAHYTGSSYKPQWRITLLRSLVWFGLNGFWIPVATSLVSPFNCAGVKAEWYDSGYECFTGAHMGFIIGAVLLIPAFLLFTGGMTALLINRVADVKKNLLCISATGRPLLLVLAIRTVLAFFYMLAGDAMSGYAHAAINMFGGLGMLASYLYFLPYTVQWLNRFNAALLTVFTVTNIVTFAALVVNTPQYDSGALTWVFVVPLSFFGGWSFASLRFRSFGDSTELTSPYMVELRARYLLFEEARLGTNRFTSHKGGDDCGDGSSDGSGGSVGFNGETGALIADFQSIGMGNSVTGSQSGGSRNNNKDGSGGGGGDDRMTVGSGNTKQTGKTGNTKSSGSSSSNNVSVMDMGGDAKESLHAILSKMSPATRMVDRLYKEAMTLFSTSPLLELFTASYFGNIRKNRHLERVHLRLAESKADASAIDLVSVVHWRERRFCDTGGSSEASACCRVSVASFPVQIDLPRISNTRSFSSFPAALLRVPAGPRAGDGGRQEGRGRQDDGGKARTVRAVDGAIKNPGDAAAPRAAELLVVPLRAHARPDAPPELGAGDQRPHHRHGGHLQATADAVPRVGVAHAGLRRVPAGESKLDCSAVSTKAVIECVHLC